LRCRLKTRRIALVIDSEPAAGRTRDGESSSTVTHHGRPDRTSAHFKICFIAQVLQRLIRARLRETPVDQAGGLPGARTISTKTHSDPPDHSERPTKPHRNLDTRCQTNGHPRKPEGQKTDLHRSIRQFVVERSKPNPMGIKCLHFKLSNSGGQSGKSQSNQSYESSTQYSTIKDSGNPHRPADEGGTMYTWSKRGAPPAAWQEPKANKNPLAKLPNRLTNRNTDTPQFGRCHAAKVASIASRYFLITICSSNSRSTFSRPRKPINARSAWDIRVIRSIFSAKSDASLGLHR